MSYEVSSMQIVKLGVDRNAFSMRGHAVNMQERTQPSASIATWLSV
jgi:hypothetical protein